MEGKVILITGAAGSIGSEITRQLALNNTLFLIDIDETRLFDLVEELRLEGHNVSGKLVDVRDKEKLSEFFKSVKVYPPFDFTFHCAAMKHVTMCEENPREAILTNEIGTLNIVEMAKLHNVRRLVFISTDKASTRNCLMGGTKHNAEMIVKRAGYTCVRFGNVMGSRGSVIPIWQKQLEQGKALTVTDPRMTRYMMTIEEAAGLVIEAAKREDVSGKVVLLDMGEPHNILQLAKEILNKAGKPEEIRMIGLRPGEVLHERLMSEEEEDRAVREGNFWIL